jgi:CRISPR-associated protein Csm3
VRLIGHAVVTGELELVTGLHIGAGREALEIGGMDNPVIRDPWGWPYVPGSSLKGKLRSLLEWWRGKGAGGNPCACAQPDCDVCRLFGVAASEEHGLGPSRLVVRDAVLTEDSKQDLVKLREESGLLFVEVKYENSIDRLRGTARNPRPVERVPAGTRFAVEFALRLFESDGSDGLSFGRDDRAHMLEVLAEALGLLEADALGGMGSRGYGKVRFRDLRCDGEPFATRRPAG